MSKTHHAQTRAQQRGQPPIVEQLLDRYGEEEHLGGGCVIRFLSKRGRRTMERDMGRQPVAKLAQWLDAYEVSTTCGKTITVGHRTRRHHCKS